MAGNGTPLKQLTPQSASNGNESTEYSLISPDEQRLAHFGKRQRFRRNFNLISIVGLICTLMLTWEGSLALLQPYLINGGPTGIIAAFLFVMAGVLMQVLVMAEMASMIPLSGGQYNWVSVLAPPAYSKFLSYMTGWTTTIAWQAATASTTFLNATIIQALVALNYPDYNFQRWHGTLIFYAIIAVALFVTTYLGRLFPKFEAIVLVLHIVGFFAILITLVYLSPKSPASEVFKLFINGGGFSSDALSFLVGSVTVMFSFIGIDGASHMAEEIENAAVVVPRAMIASVVLNGSLGFGLLVAVLFCMGPVDQVLGSQFFFPFITIFQTATQSTSGATGMTALILVVTIAGSIGLLATSSRMLWAFAREDGVPGSKYISKIEPKTALPVWSIGTSALISLLLALINIGSTTAFNAFTGLTVAGTYSSFIMAASVMLYKRLTTPSSSILWGPFTLGRSGVPITIVALIYSIVGWFFSFWPPTAMVTVGTFNWSLVVYFSTLILAMIWWAFHARYTYTGPKMEFSEEERFTI